MPRRRSGSQLRAQGFRQWYSSNGIQATSSGRASQSEQTTRTGRYVGSRQTMSTAPGGKVGRSGRQISRDQMYYDRRVAYYKNYQSNPELRAEVAGSAGRRGSLGLTIG